MEEVIVIKDSSNGELFAIVTEKNGSLRAYGSSKPGKAWAQWLDATHGGRGQLDPIVRTLPLGLSTEGPRTMTRKVRSELTAILPKITESVREEISTGRVESKSLIITLGQKPPASRTKIQRGNQKNWNAQVNYKALAFASDANLASIAFEIKRTRAVFDPDLGPSGGYRCPVGTRYGGQITDRFGRGCGWGIARRLLNTVVDAGERVEEALDRRRERRVNRRNRRMQRRLGNGSIGARTGRINDAAERAERLAERARAFARRMDGNSGTPRRRRGSGGTAEDRRLEQAADRADRVARRARRFAERMVGPDGGGDRDRRRSAVVEQANKRPRKKEPMVPAGEVQRPKDSTRKPAKKAPAKKAPAKKAAAKKAAAKKAAAKKRVVEKAPVKKTPAKKASTKKPDTPQNNNESLNIFRLDETDRQFVEDFIKNQGLFTEKAREDSYIERAAGVLSPDGLDDMARTLENAAKDDRRKAQSEARSLRDRIAYNEVAKKKEDRAKALRRRAEVERVNLGNRAPSAPKKAPAKKAAAKKAAAKKAPAKKQPSLQDSDWDIPDISVAARDAVDKEGFDRLRKAWIDNFSDEENQMAMERLRAAFVRNRKKMTDKNLSEAERGRARSYAEFYQGIYRDWKDGKLVPKSPAKKAAARKASSKKPSAGLKKLEDLDSRDRRAVEVLFNAWHSDAYKAKINRRIAQGRKPLDDMISAMEQKIVATRARRDNQDLGMVDRVFAAEQLRVLEADLKRLKDAKPKMPEVRIPRIGGPADNPTTKPETPKSPVNQGSLVDIGQPRKAPRELLQRQKDHKKAALGVYDKNGFADVVRVEKGNKGITSQDKANKYLADGGDMIDVPDDYLYKAIKANMNEAGDKRFRIDEKATSANSPYLITDTKTGQRFLLKKYDSNSLGYNEDMNDLIGNNIHERFGFLNGAMRVAGPVSGDINDPKYSAPIVIEMGQNMVNGDLKISRDFAGVEVEEMVRLNLLDFVLINSDRHGKNYFVVEQNGKKHIYPIDPSLAFNARKEQQYFKGTANMDGFKNWYRSPIGGGRNKAKERIRNIAGISQADRDRILEAIKATQRDLKRSEQAEKLSNAIVRFQGVFPGRKYATSEGRNHQDAAKRLEWLMNVNAEEILEQMIR